MHALMAASEKGDESIYALQEKWDEVEDNDDIASVRSGVSSRSSGSSSSSSSSYMNTQPLVATHAQSAESKATLTGEASDHYLVLDMREDDEAFKKYHIQAAMQYTPPMLRRDFFPPQLYKFVRTTQTSKTSRLSFPHLLSTSPLIQSHVPFFFFLVFVVLFFQEKC